MVLRLGIVLVIAHGAFAAASSTVNIQVGNQVNPQVGLNGRLQLAMSTSFQLVPGGNQFFNQSAAAQSLLTALYPQHARAQVIQGGIPLSAPNAWNFTVLNSMFPPIQASGDHSPEFQIGTAPAYMNDSSGHILPSSFGDFAAFSADLVRYYNTGGFDDSGVHYQSSSPFPVTWWGIFNEPNGNGVTAQEYVNLYNALAPAMVQADPNIKFAALELSDFGSAAHDYVPTFVANVAAPVNALATHFYSTCNQKDLDNALFSTVPVFSSEVRYIYSQLATRPGLASVPVWVTENNVNADFDAGNGKSNCNPGTPFVLDPRGTSPFFAAWRSLVFAQLGEAGAQALYHWSFGTNQQYGEIDSSANPYLSYWVDYYLSHWFPAQPGQDLLHVTSSGCCLWINNNVILGLDTHTLAARNEDGSVVILMSNHALRDAREDNNGPGTARTFALDLSALGQFDSATLVTMDASTPRTGPVPASLTSSAQMQVTLQGYGAALLRLAHNQPVLPPAGVSNAASYSAGSVAPGELVALIGSAIGPAAPAYLALLHPRLVSDSLAGVHVLFDGVPASVLYASATQVNVVVPYEVAGRASTRIQLEYLGALSAPVTVPVTLTAPGVFTLNASGRGPGAILNAKDESVNSSTNPAAVGDWVSIFGTGAGQTNPPSADGLVASGPLPLSQAPVSVTIGGLACDLNYAGAAPGLVSGVLQINARVPAGVSPGPNVPVTVKLGNVTSQSGVTVAIR